MFSSRTRNRKSWPSLARIKQQILDVQNFTIVNENNPSIVKQLHDEDEDNTLKTTQNLMQMTVISFVFISVFL